MAKTYVATGNFEYTGANGRKTQARKGETVNIHLRPEEQALLGMKLITEDAGEYDSAPFVAPVTKDVKSSDTMKSSLSEMGGATVPAEMAAGVAALPTERPTVYGKKQGRK